MDVEHNTLHGNANQHGVLRWTVADAAARDALVVAAPDVAGRKVALQTDTGQLWVATSVTPTFRELGDVPSARSIVAGAGLTGGGTLAADRTLNVIAHADGSIVVGANDVQVAAAIQSGAALGATSVQPARTLTAGSGLTGGGDLSADRTFNVAQLTNGHLAANAGIEVSKLEAGADGQVLKMVGGVPTWSNP